MKSIEQLIVEAIEYGDTQFDSGCPYGVDDGGQRLFLQYDSIKAVEKALNNLFDDRRDVEMFKMYFGMDSKSEKTTTSKIGRKFGISTQRVDTKLKSMVRQLKEYLRTSEA